MHIKKVLSVLLSTSMLLSVSVSAISEFETATENEVEFVESEIPKQKASSGTCGESVTWTLDDEGTLTITGTGDMTNYLYNNSPWYSIRSNIKKIIIKDGVTSIGENAFWGEYSLTFVVIPDSVTSIGDYSFSDNYKLESVVMGNGVKNIGCFVFAGCDALTDVYYGGSEADWAEITIYEDNDPLKNANITYNYGASNIVASGTCGENVTWTLDDEGTLTISGTGDMTNCSDKWHASWYPSRSMIRKAIIKDGVTSIGDLTFEYCESLASVTIPDSVTSIGEEAFWGCSSLMSVIIPNSVISMGVGVFADCSSLMSVAILDSVTSIGSFAFYNCTSLADVYYGGSEADWNDIIIGSYNDSLLNADIHFDAFSPKLSEGSGYVVNEAVDAVVAKPSAKGGESLDAFMGNIATSPEYVRVVDADGNVQTSVTKLITGYKVQLLGPDGSAVKEYDIVILGDTDRNGRFTISDVSGVQSAVAAKPDKNTVEFLEANIDGNARLSVTDASALQSFLAKGTW